MKFSGKVGSGPVNKRLNFGGNLDHHLESGYRDCFPDSLLLGDTKSGTDCTAPHSNYDVIMSTATKNSRTDIATLVRRTLAEVSTVPVFL